jgi:hypothetical protein
LIRGFIIQYWISTLAFIALSVGLAIMAPRNRRDTFNKCKAEFPVNADVKNICINRVSELENIIKIASFVQGGVLVAIGIIVLIFGIREFKDIKMDEETNSLIEKATFEDKNEIQSDTSSISTHNLLPPGRTLNRNVSNASTAYSNSSSNSSGSINRYAPMDALTPNSGNMRGTLTNASIISQPQSSNYHYPNAATNLSRNPTNASNYTSITTASSLSSKSNYSNRHYPPSRNYPNVNRAHPNLNGGGLSRYPTNASAYSSISSNSNHSNYSNNNISRNNYNGTPPPMIHHKQPQQPPQPYSSQRPLQQYSSISDNNRFNTNRSPSPYNITNIPPLTINDRPIIEEEGEIDYDDYNNYNYK